MNTCCFAKVREASRHVHTADGRIGDGRRIAAAMPYGRRLVAVFVAGVDVCRSAVDVWRRHRGYGARLSLSRARGHLRLHLLHVHQPASWAHYRQQRTFNSQEHVAGRRRRCLARCIHARFPLQEILTTPFRRTADELIRITGHPIQIEPVFVLIEYPFTVDPVKALHFAILV